MNYNIENKMIKFQELARDYKNNNDLNVILKDKDVFTEFMITIKKMIKENGENFSYEFAKTYNLWHVIMLANEMYTNSEYGLTLISDHDYDILMNIFKNSPYYTPIIYTNYKKTQWELKRHKAPGMVGTINKIYEKKDLNDFIDKKIHDGYNLFILSPKYDGISCCIEIENGKIKESLTRYNGIVGNDITNIVKNASNKKELLKRKDNDCFIKSELVVTKDDYQKLNEEYPNLYKNRRSATIGICNSPKNIKLAKFITIMPLIKIDKTFKEIKYIYPHMNMIHLDLKNYNDINKYMSDMFIEILQPEFPIRVDGVVIIPYNLSYTDFDQNDIMSNSIAFKINTEIASTRILDVYPSVGRGGTMTPIAKVVPVEVNETIVSDISLSNKNKFKKLRLHYNEEIEVYSAGNVIPMLQLKKNKNYPIDSPLITLQDNCPYCGEKFVDIGNKTYCLNKNCIRVATGNITNFLVKLGSKNISDSTIETLYRKHIVTDILSLFDLLTEEKQILMKKIDGFADISVYNICEELNNIFNKKITSADLLGSLNIPGISYKKSKKILDYIDFKRIKIEMEEKNIAKLISEISKIPSIKEKTAIAFIDFISKNLELINTLINKMNVCDDITTTSKGTIVFTGFRDNQLVKRLEDRGYIIEDNITKDSSYLIYSKTDSNNFKKAKKYNIPVINITEIENIINDL